MSRHYKDLITEQYDALRAIAHEHGISLGGYQINGGYVLYTSERVVYGKTYGELKTGVYRAGEDARARIKRTLGRQ